MRYLNTILAVLLLSILFVSCAPKPVDTAVLRKTIDDYNAATIDAMKTNATDKVMSDHADDAVQLPPNAPVNNGKEAIKAFLGQMMQSGMKITDASFTPTTVDASGTVAYEVGEYSMTAIMPGMGEMKDNGKYVAVWKQQADGSWKVKAETWNTNAPMPMPDMKKDDAKKK